MIDSTSRLRAGIRLALAPESERLPSKPVVSPAASRPLAITALVACAALQPTAGWSQDAATEQTMRTVTVKDEGETAPPVTQIGKMPQLLRDIPQSITVIDRAVLDAQAATSLTDALRNVPGITLSAGEGGQIGDNVNLRGYSARTDLFVDGLRDRGQYARDTFFVESVEVLKGPASMLFGRGSTGGVINQVSKQPRRESAVELGVSVGTDDYYRLTADYNQPLADNAAFRIAAFGHRNDSSRDIVGSRRYGVAPSLRLGIDTSTDIVLSAIVQRRDDIPDYGFPFTAGGTKDVPARPIDIDRDNFLGFTDDRFEQSANLVGLRVTHEFSPVLTLREQVQFSAVNIDAKPTPINSAGIRSRRQREVDEGTLYNQTDLIARLGQDAVRHTIMLGLEVGRDDYRNQNYTTTIPTINAQQSFGNPSYGPLPASAVVTPNTFTDNAGKTVAAYANEQLELGDHWKLIGGVRWDRYEFRTEVTDNTGAVTTDFSQTDSMTSVRGGMVYQPDQIQTYYVSYGTSFNPSAETLTLRSAERDVPPEKNRSYEVGAKWSFVDGGLLLTTAVFRVEKADAQSTDAVTGIVTLDGDTRVDGFEIGLSGNITANWQALIGYTYLDGSIVSLTDGGNNGGVRDGNVLPNTPKHSASLWTTYTLPRGWQIGGGLVHADDRIVNNANTAIVDGYTRVDATAAYVATRYTLRINLQNLTNADYFEVASGGRATPAARRAALASFTWTF